jgi:hypothetical protein
MSKLLVRSERHAKEKVMQKTKVKRGTASQQSRSKICSNVVCVYCQKYGNECIPHKYGLCGESYPDFVGRRLSLIA